MNRKKAQFDQKAWKNMRISAGTGLGLKSAFVQLASNPWGFRELKIWKTLEKHHGKRLNQIESFSEFWTPEIFHALAALTDREYAKKIGTIVEMMLEGQFSESPYRRCYRSANFGYYGQKIITVLGRLIRAFFYKESVAELLFCVNEEVLSYEYLLAYELRNGNAEIAGLVREAIYGENDRIILTRQIIEAIVISGDEALLSDLLKLLVTARQQEGLRQQILECADKGSTQTFTRILKCCIDEDMFRYSSAIRALDTWTGFGYTDEKAKVVKLCAQLAYQSLTNEEVRRNFFDSKNTLEVYFALWSQGCYEIEKTHDLITQLLEDEAEDRNILAWIFVNRTDASQFQMLMVKKNLAERNEKLLACIINMLPFTWQLCSAYYADKMQSKRIAIQNPELPKTAKERKQMFLELKELVLYIGNRRKEFSFHQLGGQKVILENQPVFKCMLSLAGYEMDDELINELVGLSDLMNADMKQALIKLFLNPEKNEGHRAFLHKMLGDRSVQVKEIAVKRLSLCRLKTEDLECLSHGLRSKSSSMRSAIMSVLQEQPKESLLSLIGDMLTVADEYQNQAAVELLITLRDDVPDVSDQYRERLEQLRNRRPTTQTEILLDQLLPKSDEEMIFGPENGYGLYEPEETKAYLAELDKMFHAGAQEGFFNRVLGYGNAENLFSLKQLKEQRPSLVEFEQLCARLDRVFRLHANDEIQADWLDGSRQTILFGDEMISIPLPKATGCGTLNHPGARFEMVPFSDEFLTAFEEYGRDVEKMSGLFHYATDYYSESGLPNSLWFAPIASTGLNSSLENRLQQKYKRYSLFVSIIDVLPTLFDQHKVFVHAMKCYRSAVQLVGEDKLAKSYKMFDQKKTKTDGWLWGFYEPQIAINCRMLSVWRKLIRRLRLSEEDFFEWFRYEYRLEKLTGKEVKYGLNVHDYFRAYSGNIASKGVVMEYLLGKESDVSRKMMKITNPSRVERGEYRLDSSPGSMELIREFVDRIVSVEEKRGEIPTPLSEHCKALERVEGAHHFCALLAALGKESFYRGYMYSTDMTKKAILSRLLKRCYPSHEDSAERLKALIGQTDITENRLVEAVMYAPQWVGFAEEILGWKGLKCGVWFFHAHINEDFSAEKETEVAIYSPISPHQFNDGAFDKNWFWKAYDQLGEKRFQLLYRAAKYITSAGNQHRRSQLYTDAVLGKLDCDELEREIREKRNQEKLRCYPLLPIAKGDRTEALRRYEFISQFRKESRQFGAQRRESEKKACETALENLAITTGLMDVNRLMWQMEGEKLESIRPMLDPIVLNEYSVRLNIDENGDAGVVIEKDGKVIKTVPKALAKNEELLERKMVAKELKEQKRRSRETLEWAMINSSRFEPEELRGIMGNPILAPMAEKLVWITDDELGFLKLDRDNLKLEKLSGDEATVKNEVRLAHPYDLRSAGVWADWMHLLYTRQIVQPFKQVFREYYPLTEDERRERTISRRYAGHQVQPQRTVALLKRRGWTVDYEEGLQKVYYKENLIVRMFAMADWFSPADIEAPTLETVEFFDRKTGENVQLKDVPPILFSETMRDLDLVVSVAHVGGVDPEVSHSTVEMRAAIAAELVALLGLTNVSWIGSHAKINGSLANYSVHMGSGVVHAEAIGVIAILPVHSQKRGRIFLPFADDDPKTAEIMSKILLLAEDKKIKDPSILMQITR